MIISKYNKSQGENLLFLLTLYKMLHRFIHPFIFETVQIDLGHSLRTMSERFGNNRGRNSGPFQHRGKTMPSYIGCEFNRYFQLPAYLGQSPVYLGNDLVILFNFCWIVLCSFE